MSLMASQMWGWRNTELSIRSQRFTDNYLDDPDIAEMVQACVDKLHSGGQRLGYASVEGRYV